MFVVLVVVGDCCCLSLLLLYYLLLFIVVVIVIVIVVVVAVFLLLLYCLFLFIVIVFLATVTITTIATIRAATITTTAVMFCFAKEQGSANTTTNDTTIKTETLSLFVIVAVCWLLLFPSLFVGCLLVVVCYCRCLLVVCWLFTVGWPNPEEHQLEQILPLLPLFAVFTFGRPLRFGKVVNHDCL